MTIPSTARRASTRAAFVLLTLAGAIVVAPRCIDAQRTTPAVRQVTVAPAVTLEVLDSGGTGPALLLLAGLGHTAHVYDGWTARLLRDRFRVIAVTRRGYGASSRPATGYDSATLVRDLVAVLDTLGITRVIAAGHSIGAAEAMLLAARYPTRVDRLVILGPAVDYKRYVTMQVARNAPAGPEPAPGSYHHETVADYTLLAERATGAAFPESEVRAMFAVNADGTVGGSSARPGAGTAIMDGLETLDGVTVTVPTLEITQGTAPLEVIHPFWPQLDPGERGYARQLAEIRREVEASLRATFARTAPTRRTITIDGAGPYPFLTHPGEVTHHVLEFAATGR